MRRREEGRESRSYRACMSRTLLGLPPARWLYTPRIYFLLLFPSLDDKYFTEHTEMIVFALPPPSSKDKRRDKIECMPLSCRGARKSSSISFASWTLDHHLPLIMRRRISGNCPGPPTENVTCSCTPTDTRRHLRLEMHRQRLRPSPHIERMAL